jgi:GTP-binding protein Era
MGNNEIPAGGFRSGHIAIIGRPNVGKSTLLNQLIGEKIAIVSPKPQTTRNRILGIRNFPNGQMIFVDTPGLHDAKGKFNRYMIKEAISAFEDVDIVLFLIEADGSGREDNIFILKNLERSQAKKFLIINKIDRVKKGVLLPLIEEYKGLYPFLQIIPISALNGDGLDILLEEIIKVLPEGPRYYPEDQITDRSERFIVGEMIREKIFHLFGEEIPYSTAVVVDEFKEREGGGTVYIRATIYVEKESQKGIVVGRGGEMLKRVGKIAREDMERFLSKKVFLDLWVKVQKNWTRDDQAIRRLGYQ